MTGTKKPCGGYEGEALDGFDFTQTENECCCCGADWEPMHECSNHEYECAHCFTMWAEHAWNDYDDGGSLDEQKSQRREFVAAIKSWRDERPNA